MRYILVRSLLLLLLVSGCESSWRSQYPIGTRLYDNQSRQFFGKVVGFEDRHNFQNGTEPCPAILIEQADGGHERVWGSCATCTTAFRSEKP